MKKIPNIELPAEDGEFGVWLCYNGEPAWELLITNHPSNDGGDPHQPRTAIISATMRVRPMPIEGGSCPAVEINLPLQGELPDRNEIDKYLDNVRSEQHPKPELDDDIRESISNIVDYNFEDEELDFNEMAADNEPGWHPNKHIFSDLRRVKDWLDKF